MFVRAPDVVLHLSLYCTAAYVFYFEKFVGPKNYSL